MKQLFSTLVLLFVVTFTSLSSQADKLINFGGEIPWPLSNQHIVTVTNSRGLWKMESKTGTRIFNVEMKVEKRSGLEWIRVSELNPETYAVVSWGEGYFAPNEHGEYSPDSTNSFSDIFFETGNFLDRMGRYINMFPNGDLHSRPYLLRIVEVETPVGNVLGLSMIEFVEKRFEHFLGTRELARPLNCQEVEELEFGLSCFLDGRNYRNSK